GTAISNTKAREDLRRLAEEQAALRRVATLVAHRAEPSEVFAAVVEEAGKLLGVELTSLWRYEEDGAAAHLASWSRGEPIELRERRAPGCGSVDCPVVVDGRVWGVMGASQLEDGTLPEGTEERLAAFTELVASAISNATTYSQLIASRARIVDAAD